MALGTNIGKVSIRVLPDTTQFANDLKKSLERIEKRVKFSVNTEVDENALRVSALKAVKAINAKSASRDPGYVIKLRAELDADDLDERIRRIVREANEQLEIEVKTETSDAERDFGAFIQRLDNQAKGHKVEFGTSVNERDLHNVKDAFEDIKDKYDGDDIELMPSLAWFQYKYVQAQLTLLTRTREIKLEPIVDSKAYAAAMTAIAALSGGRLIADTLSNLRRVFENLDKNIPIIGGIAEAIAGLSAWLIASASNAFTLARSLAQIAGAGLTLPGILTGIGLGIGAMVAVLKDFNKVMPEVKAKFTALQDAMSANFWGTALEPMRDAINTLFPEFASGMKEVSSALGVSFAGLSASLKKHLAGEMTPMFQALTASILIAGGASDDIGKSIEILGRNGSKYLPRFADWFQNIAHNFREWLEEAENTGKLEQFIETAIEQIKQLGRVVANASSMLTSLAKAAEKAGGSTLTMLADTLERVADYMRGDDFQGGMVAILRAAHTAMTAINEISGPAFIGFWERFAGMASSILVSAGLALGEALRGIGEALNQPAFRTGLTEFFSGIQHGIEGLAPMWASLGAALGTIGSLIGTMAAQFAPLLASLLSTLSELVVAIGPQLEEVVTSLSDLMLGLVEVVGPVISTLVQALFGLVAPILESKIAVGLLVGAFLAIKVQSTWGAVTEWFAGLSGKLAGAGVDLDRFHGKLNKVAKVGGIIAAVVGSLSLIGTTLVNSTKEATPSVDAMTIAIERYADGMKALGDNTMLSIPAMTEIQGIFEFNPGEGWADKIFGLDTQIDSLSEAIDRYHGATTGFGSVANDIAVALGMTGDAAAAGKQAFDDYDQALAQMVESGNVEAAAMGAEEFTAAWLAKGYTSGEVAAMLNDYNEALEAQKYAQEQATQEQLNTVSALGEYNAAIEAAGGMTPTLSAAIEGARGQFVNLQTDIDNTEVSLDDWIAKLEAQVTAHQTFSDNLATISERGYTSVAENLAKLGPEAALRAQELVTATDEQLSALDGVMSYQTETAVTNAGAKFEVMDDKMKEELNKLSPEAKAILEALGVEFETQGTNASAGLALGVGSGIAGVIEASRKTAQSIIDQSQKTLDTHSPSRVMDKIGGWVSQGLAQGISGGASGIATAMGELIGKINIPNPGDILSRAGSAVISGFLSGIRSGFDKVKSTLNNLTSMLPDWKGPARTDATILYNAGELVIGGFVDGLSDHFGDVRSVLGDLTDEIEKADLGELSFEADAVASLSKSAAARYAEARDASATNNKTLIYNAAPGSSLGSEEDLFAAMNRGRSGW